MCFPGNEIQPYGRTTLKFGVGTALVREEETTFSQRSIPNRGEFSCIWLRQATHDGQDSRISSREK